MARRNILLIGGAVFVALLMGAAYSLVAEREYEAEATIHFTDEVRPLDAVGGLLGGRVGLAAGLGRSNGMQTDMAVIRSRQVIESVVDTLALHVQLTQAPVAARDSLIRIVAAPRTMEGGEYRFSRNADGTYLVTSDARDTRDGSAPPRVRPGETFRLGGVTVVLRDDVEALPDRFRIAVLPFRAAVASVQSRVRVTQPSVGAQIVSVSFRDPDPVLTAAVPNAITEYFIRYKRSVHSAESRSSQLFLEDQAATYAAQLAEAEDALRLYRERTRIIEPRTQATEQVRHLAELQARREQISTERRALAALLTRTGSPAAPGSRPPYRELAAYPTFLSVPAIQHILQSLVQLENDRGELLVRRTEESVDVRGIDMRIAELESQLHSLVSNYADGLDFQAASLDAELGRFAGVLSGVPADEVEFHRLTRNQKLLEEVYTLIETKLKETEIQAASEDVNVRLVDAALIPLVPTGYGRMVILALATILGLGLGVFGSLVREFLDRRVRSEEEVVDATGGMPVLSCIPRGADLRPAGRTRGEGGGLATVAQPWSAEAEAYRALRTNLLLIDSEAPPRVILLTSAAAEDGKSRTAANLATTFALQGRRTLLVDADLRRGLQHSVFGINESPGLAEVLVGDRDTDDVIQSVSFAGGVSFAIITRGSLRRDTAELLVSERMAAVVSEFRGRYDVVIVDTPPVNLTSDAVALSPLVDAILLVAREGQTSRDSLEKAANRIGRTTIRHRGVVLNDVVREAESGEYLPEASSNGRVSLQVAAPAHDSTRMLPRTSR